jgi:hypothetical protein
MRTKISWSNKKKTMMGLRTHNGAFDHVFMFSSRDDAARARPLADMVQMMSTRRSYISAVRMELKKKGFAEEIRR